MDIYAAHILDHYRHPRNQGTCSQPDAVAQEANSACGDNISVSLKLDGDKIMAVRFTGQGCAISQAAMSLLSETLIGQTAEAVSGYSLKEVKKTLGIDLSPRRQDCALLGLRTVQKALKTYKKRR